MTGYEITYQDIRAILSMCVVSVAVLLCHALRHFTITISHPSSWYVAADHRCGRILIAASLWFLFEMISQLYLSGQSSRRLNSSKLS
jgi:hypothetical protein